MGPSPVKSICRWSRSCASVKSAFPSRSGKSGCSKRRLETARSTRQTRSTLPRPESASIQMDEIRGTVVPDPASGQIQCAAGKAGAIDTGDPHVDGASREMHAMPRDAAAALAQQRVGLRRSVTRNHAEHRVDFEVLRDIEQIVDEFRVDGVLLVVAKVAQQHLNGRERFPDVAAATEELR